MNSQIKTKIVLVLKKHTSLYEAARAMSDKNVGCAIVADGEGHMIGVVTDRDVACNGLAYGLPPSTPIEEIMSEDIISMNENAGIDTAAQLMKEYGVRRIPVVSRSSHGKEKCVSIVCFDDLVASEAINIETLSSIIRTQINPKNKPRVKKVREGRKEHTLNRFNKILNESMGLDRSISEEVSFLLLKRIIQILGPAHAVALITKMPSFLQEDLFSIKTAGLKKINRDSITKEMKEKFNLKPSESIEILRGFWAGLETFSGGGVKSILQSLPEDLQLTLSGEVHNAHPRRKKPASFVDAFYI